MLSQRQTRGITSVTCTTGSSVRLDKNYNLFSSSLQRYVITSPHFNPFDILECHPAPLYKTNPQREKDTKINLQITRFAFFASESLRRSCHVTYIALVKTNLRTLEFQDFEGTLIGGEQQLRSYRTKRFKQQC